MSKTVDERVVSMQFDNAQFERNVSTSMSTLNKLKQSLKLDDAAKGLDNVSNAASRFNLSGMGEGIETVKAKFSALEVMAVTALANITNSAFNAGKKLVSAFTIEPIKTGFQEYETQINAVQTILANTQSKGTTLKDVNAALDELNTYADKTIYNFTEMTRNIGTFTAACVGLKESTSAIQGIANLAAVSGSNSQQASTAMYQLSQALSAGTVKLQDWNSVVNAGMGGQVFQDALKKTARAHGVAVDDMIKKNGSFRESLQEGWITSEILTETLSKMTKSGAAEYLSELTGISQDQITKTQEAVAANKDGTKSYDELAAKMAETGKVTKEDALEILKMADTAEDAATKVKTFTQLMDTLKEAAQSGWTQSWEIIVGDFEEAKELWTSASDFFSEAINKSAEARNNLLQGWADGGGRTMAIDAIKDAFAGLLNIIKPIKEAFREVFPPTTSDQLLKLTERIKDLSSKFKEFTSANGEKIKSTFKGIFSIIGIGVDFVKALGSGIIKLISNFSGLSGGLLNITGTLGDLASNLRDSIKESDLFGKAIGGIVSFLQNGIDKIKEFIGAVTKNIASPGFEAFLTLMQNIWNIIQKIGSKISDVMVGISDGLTGAFRNGDINKGLDTLNTGIFSGILLGIASFVKGLTDTFDGVGGILENVTDILDGVKGCLEAYQQDIKSGVLLKIASAVGILAVAILIISTIDPTKLATSLGAITVLFGELMGSMAAFNKISDIGKGSIKNVATMIGIAVAVSILAGALKKIGDLDTQQLINGLFGISSILWELVAVSYVMSKTGSKMVSGSVGIVLLAVAVKILASAVRDFSDMKWSEMIKGLTGVGALLFGLAGASILMSKYSSDMIKGSVGTILLAVAVKILASAVEDIGKLDVATLAKGLIGVGVALDAITAALRFMPSNTLSIGIGLVAVGAALVIIAKALKEMGSMSMAEMGKSLLTLAGSLIVLSVALNLMTGTLSGSAAMLVASVALIVLAKALQEMSKMSMAEIGNSLLTLAGSLFFLSAALIVMTGTLAGAAALLVASVALSVLAKVLKTMGEMSVGEIVKSLITLATTLAIIGVAGLLLAPVVPALLGLGAAILLIGIGATACGAGLMLIASAFILLSTATATGATAFVASMTIIIAGLLNLIPLIVSKIGEGIITFCQVIAEAAPSIGEAVKAILLTLIDVIVSCVPAIMETIGLLITKALEVTAEYTPSIVQAGFDILMGFLSGIRDNIGDVTEAAFDIMMNFMDALGEKIPELIDKGMELSVNLINGLADGIKENDQDVKDAINNLCEAILEAICTFFGIHSPSTVFKEIGENLIEGLKNGIEGFVSGPVKAVTNLAGKLKSSISGKVKDFESKGSEMISNLKSGISSKSSDAKNAALNVAKNAVSSIGSKVGEFKAKGSELITNLRNGITSKIGEIRSAAINIAKSAINGLKNKISEFESIGSNMIIGLKNGIKSKTKDIIDSVRGICNSAIESAKNLLRINSPSKVFISIGKYVDEGMIVGINKLSSKVADASSNVGKEAIDGMTNSISKIQDLINSDIDYQPTIRPVLDLSDIRAGANDINGMLDHKNTIGLMTNVNSIDSMMNRRNQNGVNDDVVSAINDLKNTISASSGNSYRIDNITYDDGSNVANAIESLIRAATIERRV